MQEVNFIAKIKLLYTHSNPNMRKYLYPIMMQNSTLINSEICYFNEVLADKHVTKSGGVYDVCTGSAQIDIYEKLVKDAPKLISAIDFRWKGNQTSISKTFGTTSYSWPFKKSRPEKGLENSVSIKSVQSWRSSLCPQFFTLRSIASRSRTQL